MKHVIDVVKANKIMRTIENEMRDLKKIQKNLNGLLNEAKIEREILDYNHIFWILTCLYVHAV